MYTYNFIVSTILALQFTGIKLFKTRYIFNPKLVSGTELMLLLVGCLPTQHLSPHPQVYAHLLVGRLHLRRHGDVGAGQLLQGL